MQFTNQDFRKFKIAHIRPHDKQTQSLLNHLQRTADFAEKFAAKIGLSYCGRLLGLLHDFGKYSNEFQRYLASSAGLIDQDHDDFMFGAAARKGKIDHSTAGAQYIYSRMQQYGAEGKLYGRLLALASASHHSGLMDSLSVDGNDAFIERMGKKDELTHLRECFGGMEHALTGQLETLFAGRTPTAIQELSDWRARLFSRCEGNIAAFRHGLLTRFLLSCLLDADRIDSACFDDPARRHIYENNARPAWTDLAATLEQELAVKDDSRPLNALRRSIAGHCLDRAKDAPGIFTLTVPTGGGKTLSSLRFALHHAQKYNLDHIFYIIPYTSIIDQNAEVARRILESGKETGGVVLEHHSNILPEKESRRGKLLAQNWDAPVVFTTMVQFFHALFGKGTRNTRPLHNLARSVLIFDEIQTLPPRLAHLFCNALNFLVEDCGSSVVLCTATQPLLGRLPKPEQGQLALGRDREIMPEPTKLFADLRRIDFVNHCDRALTLEEIGTLALEETKKSGSCLVVTNTKKWADDIYRFCLDQRDAASVFYLSTNLCPAHRMDRLQEIIRLLEEKKSLLCVSTQLIECGVDISFGAAIRFAAGLDSVLQTAGRCNRHMEQECGRVHIVIPPEGQENLENLPDIQAGKHALLRLLRERAAGTEAGRDISDPMWVERYFSYYFYDRAYDRAADMAYAVSANQIGHDDTLLNMLGLNNKNTGQNKAPEMLRQSFAAAAQCFQVIDSPRRGVIVPYGAGKEIIAELCSFSGQCDLPNLLQRAQRYTVNVFPKQLDRLGQAIHRPEKLEEVLALKEPWYDKELGLIEDGAGGFCASVV